MRGTSPRRPGAAAAIGAATMLALTACAGTAGTASRPRARAQRRARDPLVHVVGQRHPPRDHRGAHRRVRGRAPEHHHRAAVHRLGRLLGQARHLGGRERHPRHHPDGREAAVDLRSERRAHGPRRPLVGPLDRGLPRGGARHGRPRRHPVRRARSASTRTRSWPTRTSSTSTASTCPTTTTWTWDDYIEHRRGGRRSQRRRRPSAPSRGASRTAA